MKTCDIDGCEKPSRARGVCTAHYKRLMRNGDPLVGGELRCATPEDRFENSWELSDGVIGEGVDTPCKVWTAETDVKGRGRLCVDGRRVFAHRHSYEKFVGPIPAGSVIHHLCGVSNCVNPEHLEPITNKENILRGTAPTAVNAAKTHCPRGHELVDGNLTEAGKSRGERKCLTCAREASRRQAELVSAARKALGLTRQEYVARHGQSEAAALSILAQAVSL